MGLSAYRQKRNFSRTPEPSGSSRRKVRAKPKRNNKPLSFVIQKHQASHLHYDFRLEWDGALLSWAVPKGPSLDPKVKRLARSVEDHPLEYAGFEGVIPREEYGGGTVMVWDIGTYVPHDPNVGTSLRRGELKFTLHGKKLGGDWVLVRAAGMRGGGNGRNWLLIKHRDDFASMEDIALLAPCSVVSGRSLAQIARDEGGDVSHAASGDPETATRCRRSTRARQSTRQTRRTDTMTAVARRRTARVS